MKPKQYHHISTVIREGGLFLATLQQKALLISKLKNILINELPEELHTQLRISNIHGGIIKLSVPTSAMATKIRHLSPSLLKKIAIAFPDTPFFQLRCHVNPGTGTSLEEKKEEKTTQKAIPLSDHTKQQLTDLSAKITHPALAEALKKLVS